MLNMSHAHTGHTHDVREIGLSSWSLLFLTPTKALFILMTQFSFRNCPEHSWNYLLLIWYEGDPFVKLESTKDIELIELFLTST